jgi:tetratricopeptide (TPR) repeat protein
VRGWRVDGAANATTNDAPQFFISRTSADAAIAIAVADALIAADYRVLIQDKDFANRNFMDMMDAGLASGARVIAMISEDYFRSDHCRAEWEHPFADDPLNKQTRLIVLRARECTPRGLLKCIAFWDLVKVRNAPDLLSAMVLAAVDPAHRISPQLAEHWRKPDVIRHPQIRATPGFTGRGEELAALDAALAARETPSLTQSAAVQGFGGVGKSTIAREYAWQLSQFDDVYAGIWWLDAETQGPPDAPTWPGIEQGYIELGDTFMRGLAQQQDRQAAARTGRNFIEKAGFEKPWLIVYDNVDDVRTLTADAWQPPKGAHVIITSRLATKAKGVTTVEIGTWPVADAIRYLRDNSGREDLSEAHAREIAATLGCLPLAVVHAAAYLSDNDTATVATYLKSITSHMRSVPESALAIAPRAVFATLQNNIAQAEARAPGAAAVMSLAAFYAPGAIPEELFRRDAEHYPPAFAPLTGDGPELEAAIGALARLRLITCDRDTKTFSVHRLVQAAAKDALSSPSPHATPAWGEGPRDGSSEGQPHAAAPTTAPLTPNGGEREIWSTAAVHAANAAFPPDEFNNWQTCEQLLPHARSVISAAHDDIGVALANLCGKSAGYLYERAEYDLAEPLYKRSLAIREAALGPDHPSVGTSLNNLAGLYRAQGKYDLAEPLYQRALAIREAALGPDHPDVGTALNNLAGHYTDQGKYDLAEPLTKRTLAILEAALGPDHPSVATALNNLAALCVAQGKYDLAEPLFKRSIAIREAALGPDHPDVAQSLNNLAELYRAQGKYDQAEPLYQRALAIREAALGPDHPDVGSTLNNLAGLFAKTDRLDEALPLAERAYAALDRAMGADHPSTIGASRTLAFIQTDIATRDG